MHSLMMKHNDRHILEVAVDVVPDVDAAFFFDGRSLRSTPRMQCLPRGMLLSLYGVQVLSIMRRCLCLTQLTVGYLRLLVSFCSLHQQGSGSTLHAQVSSVWHSPQWLIEETERRGSFDKYPRGFSFNFPFCCAPGGEECHPRCRLVFWPVSSASPSLSFFITPLVRTGTGLTQRERSQWTCPGPQETITSCEVILSTQ